MSKVVVPASVIGAAFANAALFASTNKTRPILCCALVNWTAEQVEIVATDSYGLLVQRFDRNDGDDEGSAMIDRAELLPFSKLAKACKVASQPAVLQVEGDEITFTVGTSSISGKAYTYGDFPNWRQLITGDLNGTPLTPAPSEVGCSWAMPTHWYANLGKLASLDKRKNGTTITIQSGVSPLKPCSFELGTEGRVFGLVMPSRLP